MRGFVLSIWISIDPFFSWIARKKCLANDEVFKNVFRVKITKYLGRNLTLSDGTQIHKKDFLVKIHLHNAKLLNEFKHIKSEIKKGRLIYQYVYKSLPEIEKYIQNHKYSNEIKGIIGISLLHKGCERLGFEIVQIEHPLYRWFKHISFIPIALISTNKPSLKCLLHSPPSYLFMSKNKLKSLYKL